MQDSAVEVASTMDSKSPTELVKVTDAKDAPPPAGVSFSKNTDKPATHEKAQKDTKSDMVFKRPKSRPKVKFTVNNLNNISESNRDSRTFSAGPTPSESKPIGTYFDSLNVKCKLTTNKGNFFSIDVQPDMRFFSYYVSTTTKEQYKTMVVENQPYVSLPSIIGYKIALYIGQLLILDLHARKVKSCFSEPFEERSVLSNLLANLMTCKLPSDVRIPLEQMAPLKDPLRPEMSSFQI